MKAGKRFLQPGFSFSTGIIPKVMPYNPFPESLIQYIYGQRQNTVNM